MQPHLRLNVRSSSPGQSARAADIVTAVCAANQPELTTGCRLPPVRVLAHQLGIAKNTVVAAYEELAARGVVVSRERQGYFLVAAEERAVPATRHVPPPPVLAPPMLPRQPAHGAAIPLSRVFVDPDLLPRERIADCFRSVLTTPGIHTFYDAQGYPPLREAIAARLNRRGIPAHADHVVITTGSQQALDVVCRALVDKRIATENPAYSIGKRLFEMNAVATTGVDVDPFTGIDLAQWEQRIAATRPALLYLTSSFQNPTGYSYSSAELAAILAMAERHGCGILEDDWGSDMLSFSEFRPPLRALGGDNVLYMNSFTKKLLPSLRAGYVLANRTTVDAVIEAKRVATLGNPTLVEAALAEFLDRGYFDTHLAALQCELDQRYASCLAALHQTMPAAVRWTTPGGGPLLWLELPRAVKLTRLERDLAARSVAIELSTDAFFASPHLHGFKIGYAYPRPADLARGLEITAEEICRQLEGS